MPFYLDPAGHNPGRHARSSLHPVEQAPAPGRVLRHRPRRSPPPPPLQPPCVQPPHRPPLRRPPPSAPSRAERRSGSTEIWPLTGFWPGRMYIDGRRSLIPGYNRPDAFVLFSLPAAEARRWSAPELGLGMGTCPGLSCLRPSPPSPSFRRRVASYLCAFCAALLKAVPHAHARPPPAARPLAMALPPPTAIPPDKRPAVRSQAHLAPRH